MEISLNWLKKYLPITLSPEELEEGLTLLGIECTHESQSLSFSDVVLGRVTECDPHPQSDHLSVCMVDLGGGDQYQIVCGAPNVKAGILVPVAKVGATLSNGEFTIKKAKLRGVASMGMICSGKELQFNEDHEGILILESDLPLGTSIEKVLDFKKDTVFSMDITPNRGDCFSHLGIAREVALLENTSINKPEIDLEETGHPISDQIKIDIQAADGCPRYAARVINNVKVGPSPEWLVEKLQSIGLKSINNVVDAANYVLMDFGHPMHTFDLDKLSAKHIHVRYARENESMVLLDDSEKKLTQDHLLICDGDEPVALAGIMGGRDSEISNGTTNILIESAYFNPVIIRKGAKKLDLSTDASKRFERDTDIKNLIPAMNYLSELIVDLAGGEVAKGILDVYPKKKNAVNVILSLEKCNNLLGISLSKREIITILEKLNISCVEEKNHINCAIPTYRNDLTREVDLIEEIARVYGYEKIPESKIFSGSYQSLTPNLHSLDDKLRQILCYNGFSEHYSNSLQIENVNRHFSERKGVSILNPLSSEMSVLRNSILPGLLSAVAYNENRQNRGFKLFEIGAIHEVNENSIRLSEEYFFLGLVWHISPNMHWRKIQDIDIFTIKGEIQKILQIIGIRDLSFELENNTGLDKSFAVKSKNILLGNFGEISGNLRKEYHINGQVFAFQANIDTLSKMSVSVDSNYVPPSIYPSVTRDIALLVDKQVFSEEIIGSIQSVGGKLLIDVILFDYYEDPSIGSNKKSLAYSLKFQSSEKTLKDKVVDKLVNKILHHLKQQFGAIQR